MTKFSFYFWRTLFILFTALLLSNGITSFFKPSNGITPLPFYLWGSAQIIIALWMIREIHKYPTVKKGPLTTLQLEELKKISNSDKIIITIITTIHTIFYLLVVIPNVSAL